VIPAGLERLTQCGFRLEELEADQAAADRGEGFVDVIAALVADPQPPVLVQPGDRALDDPALVPSPEPCGVFGAAIFAWMRRRPSSRRPFSRSARQRPSPPISRSLRFR
jgi:hypothetical protein